MVLAVHHKRPVGHKRFVERLAAQDEEFGIFEGVKTHHVAAAVVQGELLVTQEVSAFSLKLAFDDVRKGVVRGVDGEVETSARRKRDVVVEGRCKCEDGGGAAFERADHDLDFRVAELDDGRVFALVDDGRRVAEFFLRRRVEPNLKPVHGAAVPPNLVARDLLVDGAPTGTEEHEFAFAVNDVVGEAVRVAPASRNQVRRWGDARVGVGFDVHAQGAGLDPHGPKLIQHHPRRHEVGVVAGKGSKDGRVLDHRALGRQHARNRALSAFGPHAG